MATEAFALNPEGREQARKELLARVEAGLNTIGQYRQYEEELKVRARGESRLVSSLSAELDPDEEWLLTVQKPVNVITGDNRNYQTTQFRAKFIRPLDNGVDFLSASGRERVTLTNQIIKNKEFDLSIVPAGAEDAGPAAGPRRPTEVIQPPADIL